MSTLTFCPDTHTYSLNGGEIPSVTDILRLAGLSDYSGVPPALLANACWRGEQVHLATQFYDEHDIDMSGICAEIEPYLFAWATFREMTRFEPDLIEYRSFKDDSLPFGFTVDRVGTMGGERWLLDIKTSSKPAAWWPIQTIAYCDGLNDLTLKRGVVHLKKDGTYKLLPHTHDNYDTWRGALLEAHWQLANGRNLKGD